MGLSEYIFKEIYFGEKFCERSLKTDVAEVIL